MEFIQLFFLVIAPDQSDHKNQDKDRDKNNSTPRKHAANILDYA